MSDDLVDPFEELYVIGVLPVDSIVVVERVSLGRDTADNLREDVEYEGTKRPRYVTLLPTPLTWRV